jgi:hypothetical protein
VKLIGTASVSSITNRKLMNGKISAADICDDATLYPVIGGGETGSGSN